MPRWAPWAEAGVEPSISDVLSDPIVEALMRADGVRAADVLAIIFGGEDRRDPASDRCCSKSFFERA